MIFPVRDRGRRADRRGDAARGDAGAGGGAALLLALLPRPAGARAVRRLQRRPLLRPPLQGRGRRGLPRLRVRHHGALLPGQRRLLAPGIQGGQFNHQHHCTYALEYYKSSFNTFPNIIVI